MRRILAPGLVLLLASCHPRPRPETPPPTPPADPLTVALYQALDRDRALFMEGLRMLEEGSDGDPGAQLAEATSGLTRGAGACEARPGCDVDRFLRTFDGLIAAQTAVLEELAERGEATLREAPEPIPAEEPGTEPFLTELPAAEKSLELLRGTDLRELITLTAPVQAAIDDWLTWLRPDLLHAREYYEFLRQEMLPVYEEAGLPEALLFAIVATESGGKVHAESRAGAAGPLQFIRSTGRLYGLREVDGFDLRFDPESATRANVAYLEDRFAALGNDLEKALAAYNGGENRVRSLHRRLGGASLWDARFYYSLPRETRQYVPRVLAAAWLFLHPEDYGLAWPETDAERATLDPRAPISISELSVCLGQAGRDEGWFRILRNLNPRLGPGEQVEPGSVLTVPRTVLPLYEERCLEGELLERAHELHVANYPDGSQLVVYVVQRGDTLGRIAARHRCASIQTIAEINRLRPPDYVIRVGQRLEIPGCE